MKLECYVDTVISDKCHIEEIALLIIAKMYNIHIGVLYHFDFWTTNKEHDIDLCHLVLAYEGHKRYVFKQVLHEITLRDDIPVSVIDKCGVEHNIDMYDVNIPVTEDVSSSDNQPLDLSVADPVTDDVSSSDNKQLDLSVADPGASNEQFTPDDLKLNQDTGEVTPQDLSLNQVESELICENQDELHT